MTSEINPDEGERIKLAMSVMQTPRARAPAGSMARTHPWVVRLLARRSPEVLYFADTREPVLALTLDDGPDPESTPAILDLLESYEVRATFFPIGTRIAGHEDLIRRLVAGGHELGNHLSRDRPSIFLRLRTFEKSLLEADANLRRFTSSPRWFRPSSGWYSSSMLSVARSHGYRCALGSVYPYDAQIPSATFSAAFILRRARPGSIIVLHDGGARGRRAHTCLTRVLPALLGRGYRFHTLSEMSGAGKKDRART